MDKASGLLKNYRTEIKGCETPAAAPIILGVKEQDNLTAVAVKAAMDNPPDFLLILVSAGYAAIAVGKGASLGKHRAIQKYMTRKKLGISQLTYLNKKGKSRAGSRIRLAQAEEFFNEIWQTIDLYTKDTKIKLIFMSITPKLKGELFKRNPVFSKKDPRIRSIPLNVRRPNFAELKRVHEALCKPIEAKAQAKTKTLMSYNDWESWAIEPNPDVKLAEMMAIGGLHAYPELTALVATPQDPLWHPEGDVWTHTVLVVKEAARIAERENLTATARTILIFAALCHDLGKPYKTAMIDGRIRSRGHDRKGRELSFVFLKRLESPPLLLNTIPQLVAEHLAYASMENPSKKAITRLIKRLYPARLSMLLLLIEADHSGRPPKPKGLPAKAQRIKDMLSALPEEQSSGLI